MLIAEIGNNHFGNYDKAKELIYSAHQCGADIIKSQAFLPGDITGSMPPEFYMVSAFSLEQYLSLIDYARSIGNDLFYSIFSDDLRMPIQQKQCWHKFSASQTRGMKGDVTDSNNVLVSVPWNLDPKLISHLRHSEILYASEYMTEDPDLCKIKELSTLLERDIGYSDHTIGIQWAMKAYHDYDAKIIEKHFTLRSHETWEGCVYRDTIHGATPKEFTELSLMINS